MTASVVMCTYNGAKYITEQLTSLTTQNLPPDEIVINDDGSTDDTASVVRSFARTSPVPIRFAVNERNLGVSQNFSRGIEMATGEFVFLCDQDDIWHPDRIRTTVDYFRAHANIHLVVCNARLANSDNTIHSGTIWKYSNLSESDLLRFHPTLDYGFVLNKGFPLFYGCMMAFRKQSVPLFHPIPASYPWHDRWIGLVLSAFGPVGLLPEPQMDYRQHSTQTSGSRKLTVWQKLNERLAYVRKLSNRHFYDNLHREDVMLQSRIIASLGVDPSVVKEITSKVDYSDARRQMRSRFRPFRLPLILDQLRKGHYAKFGRSRKTPLVDLFL